MTTENNKLIIDLNEYFDDEDVKKEARKELRAALRIKAMEAVDSMAKELLPSIIDKTFNRELRDRIIETIRSHQPATLCGKKDIRKMLKDAATQSIEHAIWKAFEDHDTWLDGSDIVNALSEGVSEKLLERVIERLK